MTLTKKFQWIVYIALIVMLTSGCGLTDSKKNSIDPPQVETGMLDENDAVVLNTNPSNKVGTGTEISKTSKTATTQVTLYFKDTKGYVAPLSVTIPSTQQIAKKSLEYMVDGGPLTGQLPQGFTALIPKGTLVKDINLKSEQKLAIVNFSNEFANYNAQDERKIMEAVTWTLTGFSTIDKVQFWINGKDLKEMPVFNTPLDNPLSRAMGINIEIAPGVNAGQSTPVTLYFSNQTNEKFTYYVPITRLVKRTDDIAKTTLNQLILGPHQKAGLTSTLAANTEVIGITQTTDSTLITVDFNDKLLDSNKKASSEALQSVVLSLTENTGVAKVRIMVNGNVKVNTTDNHNYSKPVSRPSHVNVFKL